MRQLCTVVTGEIIVTVETVVRVEIVVTGRDNCDR